MFPKPVLATLCFVTTCALGAGALAQASHSAAPTAAPRPAPFTLGGYAETFVQVNFNDPSNGITHLRGFDNRHGTFTISNVALDANWSDEKLLGRVVLQVGHTPSTYYLSEPSAAGADGANASNRELWKYLQQAYTGYRFGPSGAHTLAAGLFLSPIGPESMAVHDNWNWSRSNLFFGLPFFHTGVQGSWALTEDWAVRLALFNGWNAVVDGNDEKSFSAQLAYTRAEITASLLYFGGVERPRRAPEGRAWRHLWDAHVTWHAKPQLSILAHANGGFEPNRFGVSAWSAAALYARVHVAGPLFAALRGDVFFEHHAASTAGRAAPIFWPAPWVGSGTATLDIRPHERIALRIEFRHDHAGGDLYFGGDVVGDGVSVPYVPNRTTQNTATAGVTTWF